MESKIRLGIVGAGSVAAEHLAVLQAISNVEVVGITSRTRLRAEQLASKFSISHVADDLESLIKNSNLDGLLVLVSADQVYSVTSTVLSIFDRPVFLEKPPGLTPVETLKLAELAEEQGVATMVGFNRRYYAHFNHGLEIIRRHGDFMGILVEGHERFEQVRAAGFHSDPVLSAWLYANSTHTIDLLRFFAGEVKDIHSVVNNHKEKGGDQFSAAIRFESGAIGTYLAHWFSPGGWRVVLYGEGVTVEFKPLEQGVWVDAKYETHRISNSREDGEFKPGFYGQMMAFCQLVRCGEQSWPAQNLRDAYRTMMLAFHLSAGVS